MVYEHEILRRVIKCFISPIILSFLFVAGEYKWSSIAWGSRFDGKVHSTNTHFTLFFEYDMSDLKHSS
jgi:hypothetical protein